MKRNLHHIMRAAAVLPLSAACLSASAQSYDKLWKQFDEYAEKDLPKSALTTVGEIRQKAVNEKNDGQLLRAAFSELCCNGDIAPDSADVCLEAMERALESETRPVVKALWHNALGQYYTRNVYNRNNRISAEESAKRTKDHFRSSLADMEVLANAKCSDYVPAIVLKDDSRYFGNDLLHVLLKSTVDNARFATAENIALLDRAISLYKQRGADDAVVLLSLQRIDLNYGYYYNGNTDDISTNKHYKALCELAEAYPKSAVVAKVYEAMTRFADTSYTGSKTVRANNDAIVCQAKKGIELSNGEAGNALRNFLTEMTNAAVRADGVETEYAPVDTIRINVHARNAKKVTLRLVSITGSLFEYKNLSEEQIDAIASKNAKQAKEISVNTSADVVSHYWYDHPVTFAAPSEPGIYRLELCLNGKKADARCVTVTNVAALNFASTVNENRITAVDRTTGRPIAGAKIDIFKTTDGYGKSYVEKIGTHTADGNGCVNIKRDHKNNSDVVGVSTETDAASAFFSLESTTNARQYVSTLTEVKLYTDRAVYRPGQKVKFSGVAYARNADDNDDYKVANGFACEAVLLNANYHSVDTLQVSADEFGTFSGEFTLPKECLPGKFHIRCMNGGNISFRVEEYKRPTFTAETEPVRTAYSLGDTVSVVGKATTYSGVPVGGAKVVYEVERRMWWFNDNDLAPQTGETVTDADGRFTLRVPLCKANEGDEAGRYCRYTYAVSYTVTAENGETAEGSTSLNVANRAAVLDVDAPETIYRRKGKKSANITVHQRNADWNDMEAEGTYAITHNGEKKGEGTFTAGKPFTIDAWSALPSGSYNLTFRTELAGESTVPVTLLSDADTQFADSLPPLFFHSEVSEGKDSAAVVIGTKEEGVVVFCDVVTKKGLVESRRMELNNELRHLSFAYNDDYGDGATFHFATFRRGVLYGGHVEIVRPLPNKQLTLQWSTFRSRLVPGQQEEWSLKVTRPDGSPADAQLMACLYDASLDAIHKHDWEPFKLTFNRLTGRASWSSNVNSYTSWLNASAEWKRLATRQLEFSRWRAMFVYHGGMRIGALGGRLLCKSAAHMAFAAMDNDVSFANREMATMAASPMEGNSLVNISSDAPLRTNFSETAFFEPALRTDASGEVRISFTLPQSTTQWNFRALAHDRDMNNGMLEDAAVAQKEFMVEPAMPRFVREGDEVEIPVKLTNLSTKKISANVALTLTDAVTDQQRFGERQTVALAPGESKVYSFRYKATTEAAEAGGGVLICRTMATGSGFSDGEEHYLPVLTNQVEVTRSIPFSMTKEGKLTLQTDTLFNSAQATHRRLTVEISSDPTWYAATALPALELSANVVNAYDWATRFYALTIGRHLAAKNPELKILAANNGEEASRIAAINLEGMTDATPWLQEANAERQRASKFAQLFDKELSTARINAAVEHLKKLQQTDGSLSWYPGMKGNAFTTMDVAITLARAKDLTDTRHADAILNAAYAFLKKDAAERIKDMKEYEKKFHTEVCPSEHLMRYLYLRTLMNDQPDEGADYLMDRSTTCQEQLTMYGKAITAVVLAHANRKDEAKLRMQSLMEHTVCTPEMGRYFDSPRAERSWWSYRIPTQCAAIEALQFFADSASADEMRLWLLQSKRTQMWETSRATADAVYALLNVKGGGAVMPLSTDKPVYYTLYNKEKIVGLNAQSNTETPQTVGYFKKQYDTTEAVGATSLQVDKRTDGLSWGSVRATFMAPATDVITEGSGLKLSRRFEVYRSAGHWQPLTEGETLSKGDRVRQVFTIVADRDYDFVSLSASRAACLEPSRPLSGYDCTTDLPAYRAVHDDRTDYFIEQLHKGQHQFAEELFVDRSGRFATGIASVECVYSPEFRGTAAEATLTAK